MAEHEALIAIGRAALADDEANRAHLGTHEYDDNGCATCRRTKAAREALQASIHAYRTALAMKRDEGGAE